jgi:methionyl aminopeptidase
MVPLHNALKSLPLGDAHDVNPIPLLKHVCFDHVTDRLRRASRIAAETLHWVGERLAAGITTADIDRLVREDTQRRGGVPAQLGYQGFPGAVCTSRNAVVCHGIPNAAERLEDGDIINVDVTTRVDGFHGDTSRTFAIGAVSPEAGRLIRVAEACRDAGIAAARPFGRLGDVGAAIERLALTEGMGVVRELGGHGIGRQMHQPPHVHHLGRPGTGVRLKPGFAFTVEPMINWGTPEVVFLDDGWTVVTRDGSLSAQFEHTVLITEDGVEILTSLD